MKLAIVSPKIEAKSCHSELLPARLRRICGVLREDVDAHDDDQQPADDAQQDVVLLDLALQHGVEEERRHGHEGVGAGYAESRYDARAPVLGERALYAQHSHRPDRDRCRYAYADAAEQFFQDFE